MHGWKNTEYQERIIDMKYGVVVAEDEILIQQNIIKKIENSDTGFTVLGKAQTGTQALELINTCNPYLLVTDIRMPMMDGLTLIEEARENHPELDVIIVSGYSDFSYAKQAIHLQVREYLLKPVDTEQLHLALSSLANKYRLEQQNLEKNFSGACTCHSAREIAELLRDYINKEYCHDINMNLIAENLNYSPSYLSKIFLQAYHMPPTKYLISLRMRKAKELMDRNPGYSIHMIGEAVGYEDPGYFSRIFKKYEGVSPQKYRGSTAEIPEDSALSDS